MKRATHFSLFRHVPHYSSLLVQAVQTPLLVYFAVAGNFLTLLSASLFYLIEHPHNPKVRTFFDAIWWAFCTVSTVGFGDIIPVTVGGRLVGIFLMITGISFFVGFTAVLVTVVSSITAYAESEELVSEEYEVLREELRKLSEKLDKLER